MTCKPKENNDLKYYMYSVVSGFYALVYLLLQFRTNTSLLAPDFST